MQTLKKFLLLINSFYSKFIILLLLIIVATFIEGISIGIVFPILSNLQEINNDNLLASLTLKFVKFLNFSELDINKSLILFFLVIIIFKNLYLVLKARYQANFVANIEKYISHHLLKNYLKKDYLFFTKRDSSDLSQICIIEASQFSSFALHITNLISEIFVIVFIISLLLYINFQITFFSLIFFLIVGLILNYSLKKKIDHYAKIRQFHESQRFKVLKESFLSIQEIKIFLLNNFFLSSYGPHNDISSRVKSYRNFFAELPKIFYEMGVAIGIIILVYLFYESKNFSINNFLPYIGVYGFAIFRLMPSVNRISGSLQKLMFAAKAIDKIDNELKFEVKKKNKITKIISDDWRILEINKINFKYDDKKKVIEDFNLKIKKGDKILIKGHTGSGKSTLLNIILGFLKPDSGEIKCDGNIIDLTDINYKKKISLVPQSIFLMNASVKENIILGDYNINKLEKTLKITDIDGKFNNLEIIENGSNLSGGQKKRIGIARALYKDFDILIMDEATNEFDLNSEEIILKNIFETYSDKTIIAISHNSAIEKFVSKIVNLSEVTKK